MRPRSSTGRSRRSTGSSARRPPRALRLLERLRAFYGALPAPPSHPFGVYIWEVLSVDTTPTRRDAAYSALRRVPALTPDAIARVAQAKLEAAVSLAGPLRDERVRALRAGADVFRRDDTLVVEIAAGMRRALRAVRRIPHLGRAAAERLLLFSGTHAILPLDEHALRVARRLGYGVPDERPGRVLRSTRAALLRESGRDLETVRALSLYLTHHGLAACSEGSPHCRVCPVAPDCEWNRGQ